MDLSNGNSSKGIVSFLQNARALTDLTLDYWGSRSSSSDDDADSSEEDNNNNNNNNNKEWMNNFATALSRNRHIQTLRLKRCEANFLSPIFKSLASSEDSSLTKLSYHHRFYQSQHAIH